MLLDLPEELMIHIMTYLIPIDIDNMAMINPKGQCCSAAINDYFKRLSVDKDVIEAKRQFVYNELFISKGLYKCMCYVQDNEDKWLIEYFKKIYDYSESIDVFLTLALQYSSTNTVLWILDTFNINPIEHK